MTMAGHSRVKELRRGPTGGTGWSTLPPETRNTEERMARKALLVVTLLCAFVGPAQADLISLGPGTLSGQGLGSVLTVLTMTSPGSSSTESGCVAGGVGGATVVGAAACPGAGPNGGTAFTGLDNTPQNNTARSVTALNLTDFHDLRILFNPVEPGSASSITLTNLSLTLWNPANGQILDARYIGAPVAFASSDPGVGNAGFFFGLDNTQANTLNGILAAFPAAVLGLAANASDATGGPETFSFGVVAPRTSVPEPTTLVLLGFGITAIGWMNRKHAR